MGQDLQGSVALLQDFSVSTPRDISSIALGKSRGGRVLDLIRRAECPQRVESGQPKQIRAARAAGLERRPSWRGGRACPPTTLANCERGSAGISRPRPRRLSASRLALEAAGIEFTGGSAPGVRLRRRS